MIFSTWFIVSLCFVKPAWLVLKKQIASAYSYSVCHHAYLKLIQNIGQSYRYKGCNVTFLTLFFVYQDCFTNFPRFPVNDQ